jgi:hypothetical protein
MAPINIAIQQLTAQLSPDARLVLDQLAAQLTLYAKHKSSGKIDLPSLIRVVARAMPFLSPEEVQAITRCAVGQMLQTQMSFNLQYLQLQSQMQAENRSYTAVSNIMKTKHDTVKNSISNIR